MPKNLLQDMVKKQDNKFTVERRQPKPKVAESIKRTERTAVYQTPTSRSKYGIWLVALACIISLIFAFSYVFSSAVVTINPKVKDISLNQNLSATKDSTTDDLPFDLVVISGTQTKTVQGGAVQDVAERATGKVKFFNAFSSASQSLNIDTRLEGSNGKIYKTKTKIVVPGEIGSTPGSVEVNIYAAETGVEYNSAPLDFKIFGFKGTPKYTKIYAESVGEINGGLKGKFPAVSGDQKTSVTNDLQSSLQADLLKKATDQIPAGFILFKDAVFLKTEPINLDFTPGVADFPVTMKGTLYGLLFDEKKLTEKIVKASVSDHDGNDVYILNIRDLNFSLTDNSVSLANADTINFSLKGNTKIVWKFDVNNLILQLLGKSKSEFNQILVGYPNVDSADLALSPFWKTSVPDQSKNIKVIVNYPK